MPRKAKVASATIEHVHITEESVAVDSLTPPHPPREDTPEYAAAHRFLVHQKKAPCEVCGVTVDTLGDPAQNPFQATAIETHHWPIERSYADACDPVRVHADYPQVYDRTTLLAFVDSPANLKVLCSTHHRSIEHGIHHLLPAQFAVQKYLYNGYIIAATVKDAAAALTVDERIERAAGIEQEVQQEIAATGADPSPAGALGSASVTVTPKRRRAVSTPSSKPRATQMPAVTPVSSHGASQGASR